MLEKSFSIFLNKIFNKKLYFGKCGGDVVGVFILGKQMRYLSVMRVLGLRIK